MATEPIPIRVTVDARTEEVWMRFDALKMDDLRALISSTFAVPKDTPFIFKYKGARLKNLELHCPFCPLLRQLCADPSASSAP